MGRFEGIAPPLTGTCLQNEKVLLTFETVIVACGVLVVFLPSLQADLLAVGSTRVVTKVVMPWFADDVTITAVVRAATDKSVFILQLGIVSVHPLGARVQRLGLGDPVKELGRVGA